MTSAKPWSAASVAKASARSALELPAATRHASRSLAGSWERKRRAMLPGPRTAQPGAVVVVGVGSVMVEPFATSSA